MADYMRERMKKLALWYSRTFNPIMTHEELEPIMATLGFVGLPPSNAWKEYAYSAEARSMSVSDDQSPPPRPRLPYPRIDGLHWYTYQAFLDALIFHLHTSESDVSILFHVRGMPLHRISDRNRKWRKIEEDDGIFIYREGTLEQATYKFYQLDNPRSKGWKWDSMAIRDKGNNIPNFTIVLLKDIITV